MMDLFSSFNPISTMKSSMNWIMVILLVMNLPMLITMTMNPMQMMFKTMLMTLFNQFKMNISKSMITSMNMIITIFMMVLIMNISSLTPFTFSLSSHLSINLSLALTMWIATFIKKFNYPKKFISSFLPMSTPLILIPFMTIIETISLMIQPLTLSIRLTANVTAGHIMLTLISLMNFSALMFLSHCSMMLMELGVSLIQAYVFSMLLSMYMK